MPPHTSYIICATQRSGSTLLTEALKQTKFAGFPEEYFDARKSTGVPRRPLEYFEGIIDAELERIFAGRTHPDEELRQPPPGMSFEEYVAWAVQQSTSPNGVFGTKLMANYVGDFIEKVHEVPGYANLNDAEVLAKVFPHARYIYVSRRNKVRQAVSFWKALQTWNWRQEAKTNNQTSAGNAARPIWEKSERPLPSKNEHSAKVKKEVFFHYGAIDRLVTLLEAYDESWRTFFAESGIEPLTIVYEDFMSTYTETLERVCAYVGVAIPQGYTFVAPKMQPQTDKTSDEWMKKYLEVKNRVTT